MSSIYGRRIQISIFGESHGEVIGVTIHGLPAGIKLDCNHIDEQLGKRMSSLFFNTPRKEEDKVIFLSGYFNGYTTGSPLTCIIKNKNIKSRDYEPTKMRPSHADYVAYSKYNGFNDYRGGGHFSGRLTAPMVIVGAIATQLLRNKGINISSYISQIGIHSCNGELTEDINNYLKQIKESKDSVGGEIYTTVNNIEVGIGEPMFYSVESVLSHLLFSVPSVKAVEFGAGVKFKQMIGSEANDEIIYDNGVKTITNHAGGINGGITNGMPLVIKTTLKAPSSIEKNQQSIDIETKESIQLSTKGRHDVCILNRVIPVIDSVVAFGLIDLISEMEGTKWMISSNSESK